MERRVVPADSPYVATVGYSRAIRVGPHVHVAGTAPIMPGEADPPSDPYAQAKRCLVSSLLDPRWRVEVEVDALVG
jgi:enamine deaminase RidA (YjgF/YER057c/UK114 family)